MQKYPYYVLVIFDGGILRKVYGDKKFYSHYDILDAIDKLKSKRKNLFNNNQICEIEYVSSYQSVILNIWNFGNPIFINVPSQILNR